MIIKTIKQRVFYLSIGLISLLVCINMLSDLLDAHWNDKGFYLSESFLFSSFWWLFAPLMYGQFVLLKWNGGAGFKILITLLPVVLHLMLFPALIWVISCIFYDHTFAYTQTLGFALTAQLVKLFVIYSILPIGTLFWGQRATPEDNQYRTSVLISEGGKTSVIKVEDISHIVADPPYVCIYGAGKKFLYAATLKAMAQKLDPEMFVRVHKSCIVHLTHVVTYRSRQNGDYDLTMSDGAEIRLSRNYAAVFKRTLAKVTHVATS